MSTQVIRHSVLRGRVQGVGFRAFVEREALKRGLEGWVRNRRDGSVEAVLAGDADAVTAMIEACRRGPMGARVDACLLYTSCICADSGAPSLRPVESSTTMVCSPALFARSVWSKIKVGPSLPMAAVLKP